MKFNTQPTIEKMISSRDDLTLNQEGGMAFGLSPEIELYQRIATCLVNEPKFYGSSDELDRIRELITEVSQNNPEFILKLANYARNDLRLRTIPVVMLVEASLNETTKKFVKQYTPAILTRPDQMTEALAYLKSRIGNLGNLSSTGSVPAGLKKGIADAINAFDQYKLSKYNRDNEFKLKDVLKLCHPKPKNLEQSELFKSILNGTINPADTWEVRISGKGSNSETWTEASKVMPYMALVKNLRNFLEHGVDMKDILEKISNPELVKKSKMLPFQLISAYNAIKDLPLSTSAVTALDKALFASGDNLPKLDGVTVIAADHSGSMQDKLSDKSEIRRVQVADAFLAFAHKISENPMTIIYGDQLKNVTMSQMSSMIQIIEQLRGINLGGTSTFMIPGYLAREKIKVDRIIVITDEQGYGGSFYTELERYRRTVNPNVYCYMINVAGYGTSEVPQNDNRSLMMAGFSERVFDLIKIFESNVKDKISEISKSF